MCYIGVSTHYRQEADGCISIKLEGEIANPDPMAAIAVDKTFFFYYYFRAIRAMRASMRVNIT